MWEIPDRRYNSLILAGDVVLAAGQTGYDDARSAFLDAINVKDGSALWSEKLPAPAVKGGTAVDHEGRVVVSLQNGQILCFAARD